MPQEPMILRAHFYHAKGRGKHSLQSGAHHADYMADPEKDELLVDDRTTLESAVVHAKYADEREGSMGSFGSVSQSEARHQIRAAQGPVWRLIVSVGEADALAMGNGLTTKAGWETATRDVLPDLIRSMGLDPSKVQWNAAAHRRQHHGENNPHIHLLVWERGTPSRRTGALTPDAIAKVRRAFAQVLYRPELERVSAAKTQARAEAKATTQTLLRVIHGGQREGIDLEQGFMKAMTTRLQALGEHLPAKGRLAYGYMPAEVKTEVLALARWLTDEHDGLRRVKGQFLDAATTYAGVHWSPPDDTEWGGPEQAKKRQAALTQARAKAARDLYERLAGSLLYAATQRRDIDLVSEWPVEGLTGEPEEMYSDDAERAPAQITADLSAIRAAVRALAPDDPVWQARLAAVANAMPDHAAMLRGDDSADDAILAARDAVLADVAVGEAISAELARLTAAGWAPDQIARFRHSVRRMVERESQRAARGQIRRIVDAAWADPDAQAAWRERARILARSPNRTVQDRDRAVAEALIRIRSTLPDEPALQSGYARQILRERVEHRIDGYVAWHDDHQRLSTLLTGPALRKATQNREAGIDYVLAHDVKFRAAWAATETVAPPTVRPETPYRHLTANGMQTIAVTPPDPGVPQGAQSVTAPLVPRLPAVTGNAIPIPIPPTGYPPPAMSGGISVPLPPPEQNGKEVPLTVEEPYRPVIAPVQPTAGPWMPGVPQRPPPLQPAPSPRPIPAGSAVARPPAAPDGLMEPPMQPLLVATDAFRAEARAKLRDQIGRHLDGIIAQHQHRAQWARTRTVRQLIRAAFRALQSSGYDQRHAAYLSAKDQWARKKAELELAQAQGMDIAL